MRKLIALLLCLFAAPAFAGLYSNETIPGAVVTEDWDVGTPPSGWPSGSSTSWHDWDPDDYGIGCTDSFSTSIYYSAPRSLYKRAYTNDCVVNLYNSVPGRDRYYIRLYLRIPQSTINAINASNWGTHFIFWQSASTAECCLDFRPCVTSSYTGCNGIYLAPHSYDPEVWNAANQVGTPFNWEDHVDEWVCVEWMVEKDATPFSSSGGVTSYHGRTKLWLNGTLQTDFTLDFRGGSGQGIQFDSKFTTPIISGFINSGGTATYYIDNIVISESYIGPSGTQQADTTPPVVTITSPTTAATYDNGTGSTVTLAGTATDNVGLSSVSWANGATGGAGAAVGLESWSVASIPVNVGTNRITITGWDTSGNFDVANIDVTRSGASTPVIGGHSGSFISGSTVTLTGSGFSTPTVEIGNASTYAACTILQSQTVNSSSSSSISIQVNTGALRYGTHYVYVSNDSAIRSAGYAATVQGTRTQFPRGVISVGGAK